MATGVIEGLFQTQITLGLVIAFVPIYYLYKYMKGILSPNQEPTLTDIKTDINTNVEIRLVKILQDLHHIKNKINK
jgi:hypothetical protein